MHMKTILFSLLLIVLLLSCYYYNIAYAEQSEIAKAQQSEFNAYNAAIMSKYKEGLDKCTPFGKHINDVITLPNFYYNATRHGYEKVSCKEQMESLPEGICPSDLPDIINKNKVICSDPKYQDWLVHYWNTRDSIILRVITGNDTSWSGSYGGSGGSSSVDGQGNKNITISCQGGDSYSATFSKKDSSNEPLTLNVIQNATGKTSILDPYTHATTPYPIIAHPVVVDNQTTTAAYGMVSAFGNC